MHVAKRGASPTAIPKRHATTFENVPLIRLDYLVLCSDVDLVSAQVID